MRTLDWVVMVGWILFTIGYGLYRSRGSKGVHGYLLAGKSMPWYAMGLSIMATQASAITFVSTTGQAYADGMRFVQFYFGLPLAMVILSATAVPIFHRAHVYTAYEYLEQRFDLKTRTLVGFIFLIQRGLAAGVAISATSVVLAAVLGWPDQVTTFVMGAIVVAYTTLGGVKAVTWSDVQQMALIFVGLILALVMTISLLPRDIGFGDAMSLAGAAGKLNAVVLKLDSSYNVWSGLIGGMFLALAYFGTDQSQVQRYLTGKSIGQSRLSLLFNAMAKIPMQFFILFIGTMVFVFYLFERPPLLFQPAELKKIQTESVRGEYEPIEKKFGAAFEARRSAARELIDARRSADPSRWREGLDKFSRAQQDLEGARREGGQLVEKVNGARGFNDVNYIFLSFVLKYLPVGLVGLIIAVIFAAAMSTISGEVNSLASVSVIDVYRRLLRKEASDSHYLWVSRGATAFWGAYAVVTASIAGKLGSLIEVVNRLGSLFYGGMLGVFVLAFFFPRVRGTAAFIGVLVGEAAIFAVAKLTDISFLWYNVVGCSVVIITGLAITALSADGAELRAR